MMEKTLRKLFNFQKFDAHPELQDVIDDVMSRYSHGIVLNDDDLDMVAAAGMPVPTDKKDQPKHD